MIRRTPLRSKTRLRSVSPRRLEERALYEHTVQQALARDHWQCTASMVPLMCSGRLDPHHVVPLGQGGPRSDAANLRTLCRAHHRWVHEHPMEATAMGLLRSAHG